MLTRKLDPHALTVPLTRPFDLHADAVAVHRHPLHRRAQPHPRSEPLRDPLRDRERTRHEPVLVTALVGIERIAPPIRRPELPEILQQRQLLGLGRKRQLAVQPHVRAQFRIPDLPLHPRPQALPIPGARRLSPPRLPDHPRQLRHPPPPCQGRKQAHRRRPLRAGLQPDDRGTLAELPHPRHPELIGKTREQRLALRPPLPTQIEHPVTDAHADQPATHARARLEHGDVAPRRHQPPRAHQPRQSGAHHDDVRIPDRGTGSCG